MSHSVTVSEAAAKRVAAILSSEPDMGALRVSVEGGGCSGFSYKFDLVETSTDDDIVIERDGTKVVIDPVSIMYMEGSEIDFVDNLLGQSFQINNPNATASCGCGTSFSLRFPPSTGKQKARKQTASGPFLFLREDRLLLSGLFHRAFPLNAI